MRSFWKKRREYSCLAMALLLVIAFLPFFPLPAKAENYVPETPIDISTGNVIIEMDADGETATLHYGAAALQETINLDTDVVKITGSSIAAQGNDCNNISVLGAGDFTVRPVKIEIENLTIRQDKDASLSALTLLNGARVHLTLSGNNLLVGSSDKSGIEVSSGNEIEINAKTDDALLQVTNAGTNRTGAALGSAENEDAGDITINSGTIQTYVSYIDISTAGYRNGAGIGGGQNGAAGNITINGGTVDAVNSYNAPSGAAGIGTGSNGFGGNIKINGGDVTARASVNSASSRVGLGGGSKAGSEMSITINGGTVEAYSVFGGGINDNDKASNPAIGCMSSSLMSEDSMGTVTINGGNIKAVALFTDNDFALSDKSLGAVGIGGNRGTTVEINGGTVEAASSDTVPASGAGIGGVYNGNPNPVSVTINGGHVSAFSSMNSDGYGAGIGGGVGMAAGNLIKINGGTVIAASSKSGVSYGAGIGGGANSDSSPTGVATDPADEIIINGGTINAKTAVYDPQNFNFSSRPKNDTGKNVYLNEVTIETSDSFGDLTIDAASVNGVACADIPDASSDVYGIKDVSIDSDKKLWLYLPEGSAPGEKERLEVTASPAGESKTYGNSYVRGASAVQAVIGEAVTDIESFSVSGQIRSSVDNAAKTVVVTFPDNTDVSAVSPNIALDDAGSTILPASGAEIDLTSPVNYEVTDKYYFTEGYVVSAAFEALPPPPVGDVAESELVITATGDDHYDIEMPYYRWGMVNIGKITPENKPNGMFTVPRITEPLSLRGRVIGKSTVEGDEVIFCVGENVSVRMSNSEKRFSDVKAADWHKNYVDFVSSREILQGTTDTKFSPRRALNRGMFITALWRLEIEPQAEASDEFTDIVPGSYYEDAANWGISAGIIKGTAETKFSPRSRIRRQDIAEMLFRYAEYLNLQPMSRADLNFSDASDVGEYAREAMSWAVAEGIIGGADGKLNPTGYATRAEAAAMIQRFVNFIIR